MSIQGRQAVKNKNLTRALSGRGMNGKRISSLLKPRVVQKNAANGKHYGYHHNHQRTSRIHDFIRGRVGGSVHQLVSQIQPRRVESEEGNVNLEPTRCAVPKRL